MDTETGERETIVCVNLLVFNLPFMTNLASSIPPIVNTALPSPKSSEPFFVPRTLFRFLVASTNPVLGVFFSFIISQHIAKWPKVPQFTNCEIAALVFLVCFDVKLLDIAAEKTLLTFVI